VVCVVPIAIAIVRCRVPGGIEGVERLALRVDAMTGWNPLIKLRRPLDSSRSFTRPCIC
jgi:hypothetical protein